MSHEESPWLSSLLDGELPDAERSRIENHLRRCPDCARELLELRRVKALLSGAARRPLPAELIAAIEARVERRPSFFAALRRLAAAPLVWAPAAALTMAALLMTFWMRSLDRTPDEYVPLGPLLAAHSRYVAESLIPEDNLVAESYSAPDASDQGSN
ncbi:MAG: zf-HC2 domain-containing protein [Elusimicrobia bacterium]|nr:zf-HC2 domain-containing protein [Elusimicrobiota bacterium]MDE2238264.1 zf-HC2 domain-containing protein [Elusimicrobiota bacterium]MDE2425080.1 zf-HC2 domain-containing protein [Elusimicrobiota bacterium]